MSEETKTPTSDETALAVASQTALAVVDDEIDFAEDAGAGFENVTESMKIVPFLRVLQDLSPQTKKTKKEYIEGAQPGHFWETATNTFYNGESGVALIPISVQPKYIEWVPRERGGGIVRRWDNDSYKRLSGYVQAEKGSKWITPEGNEIIEYLDLYNLLVDTETGDCKPSVFSAKSTAIQAVKGIITTVDHLRVVDPKQGRKFRPAMFYSVFRGKLKEQSNEQGTWYGVSFTRETDTTLVPGGRDLYRMAKELHKQIAEGTVGVNDAELEEGGDIGPRASEEPTVDEVNAI